MSRIIKHENVNDFPQRCCGNCQTYNLFGDYACGNKESAHFGQIQCPFELKDTCLSLKFRASWGILKGSGKCSCQ
jgi:hypothetical protein